MKIGININCYPGVSVEDQIKLMKDNGFEGCFMGSESPVFDDIVKTIQESGIVIETLHAPFTKSRTEPVCDINDMWYEGEKGDAMMARLVTCVEKAGRYNIPVVVVHLSSGLVPPMVNSVGNARFGKLMEVAKENNVTIAYENQRMLGNIAHAFDYYKDAGFCWDIGHESCFTPGREYMPLFGKKLVALHVQDNMGAPADLHLIPYDGIVDFEKAARYIAESGFEGSVMLEVLKKQSNYYDDVTPEEYYKKAAAAARKLADRIEYYKNEKSE
ncbi:MAG: sugar phosphate isomerase/epimerase [Ruminococcaceae bacterium]|nr:sugar phosphate isomerase/epimerase [Oscillospiraceae bacterium]